MATLAPVPAQPLIPRRPWNTLERLTRSRTGLIALTAVLFAVTLWATHVHSDALALVRDSTVPSSIRAQEIKTALADMDADAADELLNPGGTRTAALFDQRRIQASNSLVEAAKINTDYDEKRNFLETIETVMGTYERVVQQARDFEDAGLEAGKSPDAAREDKDLAVRYYRAGAIIMDGTLLPAADALDKTNNDELNSEFRSRSTYSSLARLLVLIAGIGLVAALVMAQLYLSRRTQRTLNPALAAATLVALLLTLFAYGEMASEQSYLRKAKFDCFDSIHALMQARAVAYSANADESRFLLDPLHAAEYQRGFEQKSGQLLHSSLVGPQLIAQLNSGGKVPDFTGFLADELNNITFEGERETAIDSIVKYERYLDVDVRIHALEAAGKVAGAAGQPDEAAASHAQAIALDVGNQEGQSDWAFDQFDQALGQTLDINNLEYENSIRSGTQAIAKLDWIAGIGALLLAVLIFLGFAPRIREYQ